MFLDLALSALAACALSIFIFGGVPLVSAHNGEATDNDFGELIFCIQIWTNVHCHYVEHVFQPATLDHGSAVYCPWPNLLVSRTDTYGISDTHGFHQCACQARNMWGQIYPLTVRSDIYTP